MYWLIVFSFSFRKLVSGLLLTFSLHKADSSLGHLQPIQQLDFLITKPQRSWITANTLLSL